MVVLDIKELVKLITGEVLKQLNCSSQEEVLVLLTGGRAVWPKVKYKLEELKSRGVSLKPVLSEAARRLFDTQELNRIFGSTEHLKQTDLLTTVKKAAAVLLPTLTVNTAAKLANGIQDTEITVMTGWALMLGKPVLAVTNAADPDSREYQGLGFSTGFAGYREKLRDNLRALSSYGVTLIEADYLLPGAMQVLGCDPINTGKSVRVKGTLTRAKVQEAVNHKCNIIVPKGTVVTPLARETADMAGIKICHE